MTKFADYADYDAVALEGLDLDTLRGLFRYYREAAHYGIGRIETKRQLAMASAATPIEWILAIRQVSDVCSKCHGTGVYSWGASVNGRMTNTGPCYRCEGKGIVDLDDCFRNRGYDNHSIRRAFAGMCG